MSDWPTGLIAGAIAAQVVALVVLVLLMVKLVKVIKSQNNGKVLPPDASAKLKKMFGRSDKP